MAKLLQSLAKLAAMEDPLEVGDANTESGKRTDQLNLKLSSAERGVICESARSCGVSVSQYVMDLHNRKALPKYNREVVHELERLRGALSDIPASVRQLRDALMLSSANIARIFSDPGRTQARELRTDLFDLRNRLRDLAEDEAVLSVLKRLEDASIAPRQRVTALLTKMDEKS